MNRVIRFFLAFFLIASVAGLFLGCADLADRGKEIYSFKFLPEMNPGLDRDYEATIRGQLIEVTLPPGTNSRALVPTFSYMGSQVVYNLQPIVSSDVSSPIDFSTPGDLKVVAEDGSHRTYLLSVRVPADPLGLSRFYFPKDLNPALPGGDVDAHINGRTIHLVVPYGVSPTGLIPMIVPQYPGASLFMNDEPWPDLPGPVDFSTRPVFSVQAPGLGRARLTTNIRVAQADSKDIIAFSFLQGLNPILDQDYSLNIGDSTLTGSLPPGVTTLIPTFTVTGVRLEGRPAGGAWRTFNSGSTGMDVRLDWEFRVSAFDGSTKNYELEGGEDLIQGWGDNFILSFRFQSMFNVGFEQDAVGVIGENTITLNDNVPFSANLGGLFPSISLSPGAKITPLPTILSFLPDGSGNPRTFTVTAQSGTARTYEVHITPDPPSSERWLMGFDLVGTPVSENPGDTFALPPPGGVQSVFYTINLGGGIDPRRIFADFSVAPKAKVTPSPGYQDFRYPVNYRVTAEDGSFAEYLINVDFINEEVPQIFAFTVPGSPPRDGLISGNSIIVRTPVGMDLSSVVPNVGFFGSTVTPDPEDPQNFTNSESVPLVYRVEGGQGEVNYFVRLIPSSPSGNALEGFWLLAEDNPVLVQDIYASKAGNTFYLNLPRDIDPTNLVVRFSAEGESVTSGGVSLVSGVSSMDLSVNRNLTVRAQDNSTQVFTLNTSIASDSVPPQLSDNNIYLLDRGAANFTIEWTKAQDVDDLGHSLNPSLLSYKIVGSLNNDIGNLAAAESVKATGSGKFLFKNWTSNLERFNVAGLLPNTTYYVAVLVRDLDQNISYYPSIPVTTTEDPTRINAFSIPANSETALISEFNRTIVFSLPQSADPSAVVPQIDLAVGTSQVTPSSGSPVDFSSGSQVFTVQGEEGSLGVYTAYSHFWSSASNDLVYFFLPDIGPRGTGGAHNPALNEILIKVPFGTDLSSQAFQVYHTGEFLSPDPGDGPIDFASPVDFTVTGRDGSTRTYTVTLTPENAGTLNITITLGGIPENPTFSFSPNPASTTVANQIVIQAQGLNAQHYQWFFDGTLLGGGADMDSITLPPGQDPGIHNLTLVYEIGGSWFSNDLNLEVTLQ